MLESIILWWSFWWRKSLPSSASSAPSESASDAISTAEASTAFYLVSLATESVPPLASSIVSDRWGDRQQKTKVVRLPSSPQFGLRPSFTPPPECSWTGTQREKCQECLDIGVSIEFRCFYIGLYSGLHWQLVWQRCIYLEVGTPYPSSINASVLLSMISTSKLLNQLGHSVPLIS